MIMYLCHLHHIHYHLIIIIPYTVSTLSTYMYFHIRPKKKICVFTVRRPTLIFGPDPKLFYVTFNRKLLGPRHRRCGSPIVITLSVRLSVRPSVCLSTLRCNAITRTVFDLQTSYFIHRWRIKKGRHL